MSPKRNPVFENFFLRAVADAIAKRRKALSHHRESLVIERGVDERGGVTFERLDLEIGFLGRPRTALHFTAWEDSSAWVCLSRHKTKVGYIFKIELHTNLWNLDALEIVRRIESTIALEPLEVRELSPEEEERIRAVWSSTERPPPKGKKRNR